jgi:undecaprenyl-diphosphatase
MAGKKSKHSNIIYAKNPMYVFYAIGSVILLLIAIYLEMRTQVGSFEKSLFELINALPGILTPFFVFIMSLGSLVAAIVLTIYYYATKRRDIASRVFIGSLVAWVLSVVLQQWIKSPRPDLALGETFSRIEVTGYDFPSSFMAIATLLGLTLSLYVSRSRRKFLYYLILLVAIGGLYLAINMPIDIVAGYAVGLFSFSAVSLIFGSVYHPVDLKLLTEKLREGGLKGAKLKPASVDARGSVPFFGSYEKGPIFVKVFNQDNNAADWLFKVTRRILYNRLEDEVPSITPKRTIEHEAFITMLAKHTAGVRAPELLGVFKLKTNNYAMATDLIDANGLDHLEEKDVTDKMLTGVWLEIAKLHKHRIIHKDLRTANVMIEKYTNLPWIIDFGFSEQAVEKESFYKDNVEFIASSATLVGPKRAVSAAKKVIGDQPIKDALPYMQYAALSGATTTALKNRKGLLEEIREEMAKTINFDGKKTKAKIKRIGRK